VDVLPKGQIGSKLRPVQNGRPVKGVLNLARDQDSTSEITIDEACPYEIAILKRDVAEIASLKHAVLELAFREL
jgi:hypothetical protein